MGNIKIGVQSGNWYDERNPDKSIAFIKKCGFTAIDYNINNLFDASYRKDTGVSFFDRSLDELFDYFTPLRDSCNKYGISIAQVHALFPIFDNESETASEYLITVLERMIAITSYVGSRYLVVHPWHYYKSTNEEQKIINYSIYSRLIPSAKKYGVIICLENIITRAHGRILEVPCSDVKDACEYIDDLNKIAGEECFGFCFDTGHAMLFKRNMYQYICALGNRLKVLHIHENNGYADSHMIPFTQTQPGGEFPMNDWDSFIKGLKEINYCGALTFETFRGIDALPNEAKENGLKLVASIGSYFKEKIEE